MFSTYKQSIPVDVDCGACKNPIQTKVSSSYHLCVDCFSQLSFDSEVYTKSAARVVKNIRRKDDRITSL